MKFNKFLIKVKNKMSPMAFGAQLRDGTNAIKHFLTVTYNCKNSSSPDLIDNEWNRT
jgi:hypothetical protein